ncbi:hypothetical protein [Rhodobacter sp. CZR27]|nr:hypothetical protein [Rhodobacter sp. CZR27]
MRDIPLRARARRARSRYMMVEAFARIDTEEIDPILSMTTKAA